jgi:hypothetical protein
LAIASFPLSDPHEPFVGSYCVKAGTMHGPPGSYGPPCQVGDAGELPCGAYDGQ